ncbi:hypothetical protein BKI52_02200 [marine bacterium AO1-C]|nr:hypothetical protein BKI52_02200 [marine bacterium AO1-C]
MCTPVDILQNIVRTLNSKKKFKISSAENIYSMILLCLIRRPIAANISLCVNFIMPNFIWPLFGNKIYVFLQNFTVIKFYNFLKEHFIHLE